MPLKKFPRWHRIGDTLAAAIGLAAMIVLLASDHTDSVIPNNIAVAEAVQASKATATEKDTRVDAQDLIFFLEQMQGGLGDFSNVVEFGKEWYVTDETDFKTPTPTPIDGDLFYYLDDQRVYIYPSEERIAVIFRESATKAEREGFLSDHPDLANFIDESTDSNLIRIELSRTIPWPELKALIQMLAEDSRVSFVSPVFIQSGESMISPVFVVRFLPEVTVEQINNLNDLYNVEFDPGRPPGLYGRYLLRPRNTRTAMEVLDVANLYHENELTEYSHPSFRFDALFAKDYSGKYNIYNATNDIGYDPLQLFYH
ncbi:MAG: hypothetical protein KC964_20075 [Candidatus Omnitrophica bacterium]|nr:hypothetical protein [Candidatus Omnitrophota bacterium]